MKKFSEYLLSEKVTAVIAVVVVIGVIFGLYVGGERDAMVKQAEASITGARAVLADLSNTTTEGNAGQPAGSDAAPVATKFPVLCDNGLLDPETLLNDYLQLKLQPTPLHPLDLKQGYGPGIFISGRLKQDGGDAYVTANRLYKAIKKSEKDMLRGIEIDKEERFIKFSVLLSTDVRCTNDPTNKTA